MVASIILLVFIVLYVVAFIVISAARRKFLEKGTALYAVPTLIFSIATYVVGSMNSGVEFTFLQFSKCMFSSSRVFLFYVDTSLVEPFFSNNVIYRVDVILITIIGGLTLISSLLGFFKMNLRNAFGKLIKKHQCADIIVGYNDLALNYVKKNKNSILYIDSNKYKLVSSDKKKLYENRFTFIHKKLNGKNLSLLKNRSRKVNLVIFEDESYLNVIYRALENIETSEDKQFVFHVLTNYENQVSIGDQLTKICSKSPHLSAYVFNKYELLARKFTLDNNIAKFLPADFLENGALVKNKKVNVNIFGFGKTGQAIFKSMIINNVFCTVEKDHYKSVPVNYNIFDVDPKAFSNPMIAYLNNFENIYNTKTVPAPDKPCNITTKLFDLKTDFLSMFSSCKNDEFNVFIICLDSSIRNSNIAKYIFENLNGENTVIFYNIDYKSEIFIEEKTVIPFGFKSEFLSREMIINEELGLLAELNNEKYLKYSHLEKEANFHKLPLIEKMSNYYFDMSLRFKLNLCGLDMVKDDSVGGLSKESFNKILPLKDKYSYEEYTKISTVNALAFVEHLRWNAFYIMNGFKTLEPADYDLSKGKDMHKDFAHKKHGCLTTYTGLDIVNKELLKKMKEIDPNITMEKVDKYAYDFILLSSIYEDLTSLGYKIIKK